MGREYLKHFPHFQLISCLGTAAYCGGLSSLYTDQIPWKCVKITKSVVFHYVPFSLWNTHTRIHCNLTSNRNCFTFQTHTNRNKTNRSEKKKVYVVRCRTGKQGSADASAVIQWRHWHVLPGCRKLERKWRSTKSNNLNGVTACSDAHNFFVKRLLQPTPAAQVTSLVGTYMFLVHPSQSIQFKAQSHFYPLPLPLPLPPPLCFEGVRGRGKRKVWLWGDAWPPLMATSLLNTPSRCTMVKNESHPWRMGLSPCILSRISTLQIKVFFCFPLA